MWKTKYEKNNIAYHFKTLIDLNNVSALKISIRVESFFEIYIFH